jgi:hypothetical protein
MTSVFSGTDIRAAQNLLYFKTDCQKMSELTYNINKFSNECIRERVSSLILVPKAFGTARLLPHYYNSMYLNIGKKIRSDTPFLMRVPQFVNNSD